MLSYALFFIYLILFSWWLTRCRFVMASGISKKYIIALFVLKVCTGCFHVWVLQRIGNSIDSLGYHAEGLKELALLRQHPLSYCSNLFTTDYAAGYGAVFGSTQSYWNNLSANLIIKFLSFCDIFSLGHYYVNVIFYNFVIFFGVVALYRVFKLIYSNKERILIITCFLLPSTLFYTSTIHKDGFILSAIGGMVYLIYTIFHSARFTLKRSATIALLLFALFVLRNYVAVLLLPALLAWAISHYKNWPPLPIFFSIYTFAAIIFFTAPPLSPSLNLPQIVVNKQLAFENLPAATTNIGVEPLSASFKSFIANAPQAFAHSLFRPYVVDYTLSPFLLPLALEWMGYQIVLLLSLFYSKKNNSTDPFIYCVYFFGLSVLLIVGYTVPILGALVRYRSIYLPLLLTPIFCRIDGQKLKRSININLIKY